MLILNLGNTKIKSVLALLIRMVWNGLFVNKVLDLVMEPKSNLGKIQSNFVIQILVHVLVLFIRKACAREQELAIEMPKSLFL